MSRPEPLIHCVYSSVLSPGHDASELVRILATARRHNPTIGATGILLFCQGAFFQVLEGPRAAISTLYDRIAVDPRHERVTKLIEAPIAERSFRDWTMGLVQVTPAELAEVPGLDRLVAAGRTLAEVDPDTARSLLTALCRGRWRMRCETAMVSSLLEPHH